jgi:hypothetical protein
VRAGAAPSGMVAAEDPRDGCVHDSLNAH